MRRNGLDFTFYLGTHKPHWLGLTSAPLFLSRRRLAEKKRIPRAKATWALDSGGFSELSMFGAWQTTPAAYVEDVRRFAATIGRLAWAAIQDHMCEPFILAKTRSTVRDHQKRTVESYMTLMQRGPEIFWLPVLQGWHPDHYLRHVEDYCEATGRAAADLPLIGVGSICRRQSTEQALEILRPLHALGLRLHGFGFKIEGLARGASHLLASADSMAWSYHARRRPAMRGHTHASCSNCLRYAMSWRRDVMDAAVRGLTHYEPVLFC